MSTATATLKVCTACNEQKALDAFHRSNHAMCGRRPVCKVCRKSQSRAWACTPSGAAVIAAAKVRYRQSAHGKRHEFEYSKAYRKTPAGKAAFARSEKKRDPVKVRARRDVHDAVANGRLERGPCEDCGSRPTQAHHEDYARPLDVVWLCRGCHYAHHGKRDHGH